MNIKFSMIFNLFNISFAYIFLSLFCFWFLLCNKIWLDCCFVHVMFLSLFFLFHNLNLELGLFLLSFWLENPVDGCFCAYDS